MLLFNLQFNSTRMTEYERKFILDLKKNAYLSFWFLNSLVKPHKTVLQTLEILLK